MICTCILFSQDGRDKLGDSSGTPPAPRFFTGEKIRCTVLVDHDSTAKPIFDTAQLLLRGDVTITVNLKADIYRKTKKPLLQMSCVKLAEDFRVVSNKRPDRMRHEADFYFVMPETTTLPSFTSKTEMKHELHQLPPSIRVVQEASPKWLGGAQKPGFGVCDVAYYIEARLFLKGGILCDTSREIMVMPISEIPPPLAPEDLKNEYRLFASSPLGMSWRRRHPMSISISSLEPRPLSFGATAVGKLPSTEVTELVVTFSARQLLVDNAPENWAKPEVTGCDLAITLEATTYFLQHEEHSVLSSAEARDTPFSVVKTSGFKTQMQKFRLLKWDKVENVGTDNSVEWIATASILAHLPSDAPRLPSFFAALVSRRYTFHIQAKLSSESGACLHNRLRLKVPVQMIHHAPEEREFNNLLEDDIDVGDDLKAPPYVP